jgi:glycosyltransferase involved in cell wall biosynthesis
LWQVDALSTGTYPEGERLDHLLELGGADAALVLQRVMPIGAGLERVRDSYRHVVFDIDDAIYAVPPDLSSSSLAKGFKRLPRLIVRGSPDASSRKRPLERTLARVDACVAGNSILAAFATRHARRVVEIPTTFEPVRELPTEGPKPPVLVWHGLPDNLQYLALVRDSLHRLAHELEFRLRIISSATWEDAPIPVEFVPWSPEAQREGLMTASVGLAPLTDQPWTRGKCAFRAIQYGSHGIPTVASPVGITDRVVLHGRTGYLARSSKDWEQALRALLISPSLVSEMGAAAIHHIRAHYSNTVAIALWRALIESLEPG